MRIQHQWSVFEGKNEGQSIVIMQVRNRISFHFWISASGGNKFVISTQERKCSFQWLKNLKILTWNGGLIMPYRVRFEESSLHSTESHPF
jgi:hypothetical protein